MSKFENCIGFVLKHEGSFLYTNATTGEVSRYGITADFLSRIKSELKPETITESQAVELYEVYFFNNYKLGDITSDLVAAKMLDFMVNMGPYNATLCLQHAILTHVDGMLGHVTIAKVNELTALKGELAIATWIAVQATIYYKHIAKGPLANDYLGWIKRANDMNTDIPYEESHLNKEEA